MPQTCELLWSPQGSLGLAPLPYGKGSLDCPSQCWAHGWATDGLWGGGGQHVFKLPSLEGLVSPPAQNTQRPLQHLPSCLQNTCVGSALFS